MNNHTPSFPADDSLLLTEDEFLKLSAAVRGSTPRLRDYSYAHVMQIAQAAYRMGADVELCKCADEIASNPGYENPGLFRELLLSARRPKPPSLREQALAVLNDRSGFIDAAGEKTLRRAIEALPE